jgi:hypothetical protein
VEPTRRDGCHIQMPHDRFSAISALPSRGDSPPRLASALATHPAHPGCRPGPTRSCPSCRAGERRRTTAAPRCKFGSSRPPCSPPPDAAGTRSHPPRTAPPPAAPKDVCAVLRLWKFALIRPFIGDQRVGIAAFAYRRKPAGCCSCSFSVSHSLLRLTQRRGGDFPSEVVRGGVEPPTFRFSVNRATTP